jgi:hypothetical protein
VIRQLRRTAVGLVAAGTMLAGLTACAAPAYTYATDSADNTYFKVPASWPQVGPQTMVDLETALGQAPVGLGTGTLAWTRAYDAAANPSPIGLIYGSATPVVYVSVHNLRWSVRDELSYNLMRDLIFRVTPAARQAAISAGLKLSAYKLLVNHVITNKDGVHGINEEYLYVFGGHPFVFDQTVLTNGSTTKLYLLLVQCELHCFVSHAAQIKTVIDSFTVRGS